MVVETERFTPVRRRPLWLPSRREPCVRPRRRVLTPQNAIAFDANLGQSHTNAVSPATLTTSAAAAANTKIIVLVSYWSNGDTISTVTVGGAAATRAKQALNGSDKFEVWSVDKAAGMTSNSTVSVTMTGITNLGGILIGAVSFTGLDTSGSPVDTTNSANGTGTAWSSGAATNTAADALFIGGAGTEDVTSETSTATAGTEIHDLWNTTTQQGFATGYTIAASIASRSITGNLSNSGSTANTGALVIYKAAPTGGTSGSSDASASGVAGEFSPYLNYRMWL